MILTQWNSAAAPRARVCIVGAGAGGITLACELDGCGFDVLLLEAGGERAGDNDFYRGSATAPHPDPTQFRRVAFGGTTALWGGRCVPLDPIDLERREYLDNSGWPISYSELARHYPAAMRYCDAGDFDFRTETSLANPTPIIPGFVGDANVMADCLERYSLPTDFGKRYGQKLRDSRNVTVVLGNRAVRLVRAPGEDRIAALETIDGAGVSHTVHASVFVLAMGGIESTRILLASDSGGSGFGNLGDCLGRYYMCHFENVFGRLVPKATPVAFYFEKTRDGIYCRRQLRFTVEAQREHRLLNTAFRLHFPNYSDASHGSSVMSAIYLAKSTLIAEYRAILQHNSQAVASPALAHIRNVLADLPGMFKFGGDWLFKIRLATRKLPYTLVPNADGSFPFEFNSEQVPSVGNRVSLSTERDQAGVPRVAVTWRMSEADIEAGSRALLLLRDCLNRSGTCRLEFDEQGLREQIARSVPLGGHHMGTARMASSERQGVVDPNCAVFGLPNLFVASSAVFPTSSHANPTLTIVALAVRLAQHLRSTVPSGTAEVAA